MLVNEKELCEFRVVARHQHEPWHGQQQIDSQARQQVEAFPWARVAGGERVEDQRRAGDHQPDQALGQRRARRRRIGHQHPVALRACCEFIALGEQERTQRPCKPGAQYAVEREQLR